MEAFVLGNGVSREGVDIDQLLRRGSVYGCNAIYRTHIPTVLVATDQPISRAIQEQGHCKHTRFYTRRPLPNSGACTIPKHLFGYSSGPVAAGIAAQDGANRIYLIGFDLGPASDGRFNNVYAGTEFYKNRGAPATYSGNWIRQLTRVMLDHPDQQFVRVFGDTTAEINEFSQIPNLKKVPMRDFLAFINTGKEI